MLSPRNAMGSPAPEGSCEKSDTTFHGSPPFYCGDLHVQRVTGARTACGQCACLLVCQPTSETDRAIMHHGWYGRVCLLARRPQAFLGLGCVQSAIFKLNLVPRSTLLPPSVVARLTSASLQQTHLTSRPLPASLLCSIVLRYNDFALLRQKIYNMPA